MTIENILKDCETIAIVGCSSKQYRTSFIIASYLLDAGFRVIPVNPNENEVMGLQSYDSVFDIPDGMKVDVVNIFRNREHTYDMVKEITEWKKDARFKPAIWTQLNVSTPESMALAEENGFPYVENRCIMVEHKRVTR